MFARRVPIKTLAILARQLGTLLEAGVALTRALEVTAAKVMHPPTRAVVREVIEHVKSGHDIASALQSFGDFFPTLFVDMVSVAEETGMLPEVLLHLAEHYENNQRLKRETINGMTWPFIQFVAAVGIIGLLIFIWGLLPSSKDGPDMSQLTFGLKGPVGSMIWFGFCFGSVAAVWFLYFLLQRAMGAKRIVDPILIKIPILGHCLRSFAIARFSWAFYLTQQSGMPITRSLASSLKATGNGAYWNFIGDMQHNITAGMSLTETFAETRLFPIEYIEMVAVAEESGTVPEALHRLSPEFEESARRSLKLLTRALSVLVWLLVAGFIIYFVISFVLFYVAMLNDALKHT